MLLPHPRTHGGFPSHSWPRMSRLTSEAGSIMVTTVRQSQPRRIIAASHRPHPPEEQLSYQVQLDTLPHPSLPCEKE